MKPFFEGEQAERHGGRMKAEELRRRVAVVVAASLSVYAVLVVVSLLGGPRLGAPLIPLPGGGPGVQAAAPVAGELVPGEADDNLPPIPSAIPPQPIPAPTAPPLSTGPLDEAGQPGQPVPPSATSVPTGRPPAIASRPADPGIDEPSRGLVERPVPSMPPATKRPAVTSRPTATPQTPDGPPTRTPDPPPTATPSDPPEPPEPPESPSIVDALLDLVGDLLP